MNLKILKYADPKFVRRVLVWSTLYQMSMAFETALLALAAKNISNPTHLVYVLIAFVLVAQLPNIIEIVLRGVEQPGYLNIFKAYLDERLLRQAGRTEAWALRAQRESYLTAIGPDASTQLMQLASTLVDAYSFLLNIILTTVVLSALVNGDFSWVFALSLLLSYLTYRLFQNKLQVIVQAEQQSHITFFAYVSTAWDNLLLNNRSVHRRFGQNLETLFSDARSRSSRQVVVSTTSIFAISLVASLPIFGLDIYLAWMHPTQAGLMAALTVTLPRQLSVITNFRNLFVQITNSKNSMVRVQTAFDNSTLTDLELLKHVDLDRISINGLSAPSIAELQQMIETKASGRFLITGPNGAGKSTLLLILNRNLPDSLYLPASPTLEIGEPHTADSTGQRMLKHLNFAVNENVPVLLLDEWDANLDVANTEKISSTLDELSRWRAVREGAHLRPFRALVCVPSRFSRKKEF